MGIQGLLPMLKTIIDRCHIRKYEGERVGVDASVWLHRATYGCAVELFKGVPTRR
jgi:exonuclease-1